MRQTARSSYTQWHYIPGDSTPTLHVPSWRKAVFILSDFPHVSTIPCLHYYSVSRKYGTIYNTSLCRRCDWWQRVGTKVWNVIPLGGGRSRKSAAGMFGELTASSWFHIYWAPCILQIPVLRNLPGLSTMSCAVFKIHDYKLLVSLKDFPWKLPGYTADLSGPPPCCVN
jgi:hypothetical protein